MMPLDIGSIALILIAGYVCGRFAKWISLPPLIGMLFAGILIGPMLGNMVSIHAHEASPYFRKFALMIILIRAGLGLQWHDLKKVSFPVVNMSFIPCLCEVLIVLFSAHYILGISWIESALLGSILAAVSPAVVVPLMLRIQQKKWGAKHAVPSLILASASLDDVFAITLFSFLLALASESQTLCLTQIFLFPVSIIFGLMYGIFAGTFVRYLIQYVRHKHARSVILLGMSLLILSYNPFSFNISQFLAVITCAFVVQFLSTDTICIEHDHFKFIWRVAEIFLFVFIGSALNLNNIPSMGVLCAIVIVLALIGRSIGVWLSLSKSKLTQQEKTFCIMSYVPKATVQAAIGGTPLALGLPSGEIILTVACLSIILTAPVGAFLIKSYAPKLLKD